MVDTVHRRVAKAYAIYEDAGHVRESPFEIVAWCLLISAGTLFVQWLAVRNVGGAILVWACVTLPLLVAAGGLWSCFGGVLHRQMAKHQVPMPVRSNMARRERIKRILDNPAQAALMDRFAEDLLVTDPNKRNQTSGEYMTEKITCWARPPTTALVEKLHATLAATADFGALVPADQERALALAVVNVCLFGEK